jgi:hypothetical protein
MNAILLHALPLAVAFAYLWGFLYLWYRNMKGNK